VSSFICIFNFSFFEKLIAFSKFSKDDIVKSILFKEAFLKDSFFVYPSIRIGSFILFFLKKIASDIESTIR